MGESGRAVSHIPEPLAGATRASHVRSLVALHTLRRGPILWTHVRGNRDYLQAAWKSRQGVTSIAEGPAGDQREYTCLHRQCNGHEVPCDFYGVARGAEWVRWLTACYQSC